MRIRPPSYLPIILGFPLAVLAAVLGHYALVLPVLYDHLLVAHPALRIPFLMAGLQGSVQMFAQVCGGAAVVFLFTAFCVMFLLRGWVLWLYRKCCLSTYVVGLLCVMLINRATTILIDSNISLDGGEVNPVTVFFTRWHLLWPVWTGLVLTGVLHLLSLRRKVIGLYTGVHDERPATGDRVVENILSNGRDPRFRKSLLGSMGLHVLVILVIPWLLTMRGCVEPYRVPKGSGTPTTLAAMVKVTKVVKKKTKKRKFVVNPRSAISFHIPDLDESVAARQVEADTQLTYKADPMRVLSGAVKGLAGTAKAGKMGAGGGTQGGWPDGMENAKVRFIRMEYSGRGWDDGMDMNTRADLNFLDAFHKLTDFKVSATTESHPIGLLRKYPKGFAPPFVYMTGDADIRVTAGEIAAMREYLLEGGMLFADCGSPQWNDSFRQFVRQMFPGDSLVSIADDDPIFQIPYAFPNGAPPLWHHGGTRALGIKHKERWVVFYHPGDINDAWKTGRSGVDSAMAEGAIQMGVNIIYYAFTHYLEMTRKYRQ